MYTVYGKKQVAVDRKDTRALTLRNLCQALKYHPDRNSDADCAEKFKKVQDAYEILGDSKKRARYDAMGVEGVRNESAGLDPLQEARILESRPCSDFRY